jgi:hypothetical protein
MFGPGARATKLVAGGGREESISEEQWSNSTRVPTLRINRKGLWRFQWLTESHEVTGDGLRDVVEVKVTGEH